MRQDVRVDVSAAVGTGESLQVAATVLLADRVPRQPATVLFGFPGGAYNRHYFDLHVPGHAGYSQAEHQVARGAIFVACDHLGVGDSDVPEVPLDFESVARANAHLGSEILARMEQGRLVDGVPPLTVAASIAIGHSYGGFALIVGQAMSPVFDGICVLGYSALQTLAPWPNDVRLKDLLSLKSGNGLDNPMRPMLHYSDVPEDIVVRDLTKIRGTMSSAAHWSTVNMPGGPAVRRTKDPLTPGVVAAEAAAIQAPVFIGCGEIDIVEDPWREATAYRSSRDVTVALFPRMAHNHNFASTRRRLWDRLGHWATTVAALRE